MNAKHLTFLLCFSFLLVGCKTDVAPVMEPGSSAFFDMPWPNDIRKAADGTLDFSGFPAAGVSPIAAQIIRLGKSQTRGFGLHSPVHFTMSGAIDTEQFGPPPETLNDNSPVMLVNIDPSSSRYLERVPLKVDFDSVGTLVKPVNLLSLMPYPGYSLEGHSRYAAILFNGIVDNKNKPIKAATLLDSLDNPYDPESTISVDLYEVLKSQKQEVVTYVVGHTSWGADDMAGFTVFTTDDPTAKAIDISRAVNSFSDIDIINSVVSLEPYLTTNYSCARNNMVVFNGQIEFPRWQFGDIPYLLSGGDVRYDDNGDLIQNGVLPSSFSIAVGCRTIADQAKPLIVFGSGTGGDSSGSVQAVSRVDGYAVGISAPPLYSGAREDGQLDVIVNLLKSVGIEDPGSITVSGIAFYNYLNPVAAVGSQLQASSEYLYLKRVGGLLDALFDKFSLNELDYGLSRSDLNIDPEFIGYIGESQGSSTAPLVLATDPDFKFAHLHAWGGLSRTQLLHRKSVRELVNSLLIGVIPEELDEFHPVLSVLEVFNDPINSLSYLPHFKLDHLLVTGGYLDACVVAESSVPMAYGLARYGLAGPVFYEGSFIEGAFDEIENILGMPFGWFPVTHPNLSDGKLGVFSLQHSGHSISGNGDLADSFMKYSVGIQSLFLPQPRVGSTSACDLRYDDWEFL